MDVEVTSATLHCALCQRAGVPLTFHHLIPRKNHGKKFFQKNFSKQELNERGIDVCKLCHKAIHRFFVEMTLGKQLNTLEALLAQPKVQTHIAWAQRQR